MLLKFANLPAFMTSSKDLHNALIFKKIVMYISCLPKARDSDGFRWNRS